MSQGPILIFDKSALQALSVDETNWLDNFFLSNITPLFLIETLADLEKDVGAGRIPKDVVGHLALRTPDMQAYPCTHHRELIGGDLYGNPIPMDGRIPCNSGKVVNLNDKKGVFFSRTKEEEALQRWYKGEFLDVERQIAKTWRRELCDVDYEQSYLFFQKWFLLGKPKSVAEVKALADAYIDGSPQDGSLKFGMTLLDIPEAAQREVFARWQKSGNPPIRQFAPYFRHVYGVDLFFHLAIAADQISRVRPAGKADNKVDIAYLYYLPFCMVFTSKDKLHKRVVPLFLREDQTFVEADDLKADLHKLDDHYSALPDEVKSTGFHKFAACPPEDIAFLVTRLWDKHLPDWRKLKSQKKPPDRSKHMELIAELNRIEKAAESSDPAARLSVEETQFVQFRRTPRRAKGKWDRYGPDVK
jgi:hypothetical protein